ncbi:MAG: SHOCT domain-containing protein [Chloroflexota bacterium]
MPRVTVDPIVALTSEGQDRETVRQTYDRAASILTTGETIEYIAIAKGGLGHSSDCAVATNKRLLLYRKKVLGKFELDDCYWRDVDSLTLSDVKGSANLMVHAIQGWHLLVENLPKPQAARLQEVAISSSDRLRSFANSDAQRSAAAILFSSPSEPSIPAPSRPLASPPSTPLIRPLVMNDVPAQGTSPAMHLAERQSTPTGPRNPGTGPTPAPNGAYYIPTPESVLQNILQSSALDADLEAGVPTRPMQWSAAAFQAPALAEVQPIMVSEQDLRSETGTDDDIQNAVESAGAEAPAETLSNSNGSGLHAGPDPWNHSKNAIGLLGVAGNVHNTEPQLRITPPLTTLERIAVFSLPSGSLGADSTSRPLTDFDPASLPVIDSGLHIVPRLPLATSQATGSIRGSGDQSESGMPVHRDDASEETLRVLAEKISGHLDDVSFSSSNLPSLHWSMDNTGVIQDDIVDSEITEHIGVLLGSDDISGPLRGTSSEGNTVPDPPLAERDSLDASSSTVDSEDSASPIEPSPSQFAADADASEPGDAQRASSPVMPVPSSASNDESTSVAGLADESLSSGPMAPDRQSDEAEASFDVGSSSSSHPTAPMGSADAYLPVPGSMTSMASGPLLAASSNMDHDLEDVYKNTGPMPTQRLEGDPQFDQTDRPTSINLSMSSIPSRGELAKDWGGMSPTSQVSRTSSDDQRKPRLGNATNRTANPKAPADDPIAKMKQLKALLDAGFIDDEDYAAKKAEILSRI